jgi:hypothetical protein
MREAEAKPGGAGRRVAQDGVRAGRVPYNVDVIAVGNAASEDTRGRSPARRRRRPAGAAWPLVAGLALGALVLGGCGERRSTTAPTETAAAQAAAGRPGGAVRTALAADADLADVIDALFLGSGPLVPRDGVTACPVPRRVWAGFPRGTALRVRVSTTAPADALRTLRQVLPQVALATGGSVSAALEVTPEEDPRPGDGEVSVTSSPRPETEGCRSATACIQWGFEERGVLRSVRVVEGEGQGAADYVRDVLGRGIMGMCRISTRRIPGAGGSLMSVEPDGAGARPGLTAVDIEAARAVYASGLDPGAGRKDFIRVGLVPVRAGQ